MTDEADLLLAGKLVFDMFAFETFVTSGLSHQVSLEVYGPGVSCFWSHEAPTASYPAVVQTILTLAFCICNVLFQSLGTPSDSFLFFGPNWGTGHSADWRRFSEVFVSVSNLFCVQRKSTSFTSWFSSKRSAVHPKSHIRLMNNRRKRCAWPSFFVCLRLCWQFPNFPVSSGTSIDRSIYSNVLWFNAKCWCDLNRKPIRTGLPGCGDKTLNSSAQRYFLSTRLISFWKSLNPVRSLQSFVHNPSLFFFI